MQQKTPPLLLLRVVALRQTRTQAALKELSAHTTKAWPLTLQMNRLR
jgi:hypothetical protein